MKEDFNDYVHGGQKLDSTILRSEDAILPIEIFLIKYVEQSAERVRQTYTPYMHQHTYFEMHIPIVGTQVYSLDGEEISVHPNEAVLFSPNTLHAIPYSSQDLRKISLGYMLLDGVEQGSLAWVRDVLYSKPFFKTQPDEWYITLLRRVFKEGSRALPGWIEAVVNLVSYLVIDIARENLPAEKSAGINQGLQRKRIESIERFIMDNISAPINNQMVAQHMYLSIRQLDRVTLSERGMTLKNLIDEIKMREARRMLLETEMGQKEIASTLGFSEASSFNRFFHRFVNTSPGRYRQQNAAKRHVEESNTQSKKGD